MGGRFDGRTSRLPSSWVMHGFSVFKVRLRPPSLGHLPASSLWGSPRSLLHSFLDPAPEPPHRLGNLPTLGPTGQPAEACAMQFPVCALAGQLSSVIASAPFRNPPPLGICVFFLRFLFHTQFTSSKDTHTPSVNIPLSLVFWKIHQL